MCDDCEHLEYLEVMDNMLEDPDYEFAVDTIEGIHDWVESKNHITDKQKEAIENIRKSVE